MKQTIILGLTMLFLTSFAINKELKSQNNRLHDENTDLLYAYDDVQAELSEYKVNQRLLSELGK